MSFGPPDDSSGAEKADPGRSQAPLRGGGGVDPLNLSDAGLLADCDVHRYRASGPGGQKRNKPDSAVRLRHRRTGTTVVGTESRSQHENRARALRRLREALALSVETPTGEAEPLPDWLSDCVDRHGRLQVGKRHERYYHFLRRVVSLLRGAEGRVAPVAARLGVTTSHLIEFLRARRKLWARANALRKRFGHGPLK